MSDNNYDAIICGAGPAGCVCAFLMASAGLSVLILEKFTLPRIKLCAGGIPGKALRDAPGACCRDEAIPITRHSFTFRGGLPSSGEISPGLLYSVERGRFDHSLALAAVKAGAHIIEGQPVTKGHQSEDAVTVCTSSGEEYHASFLIGADGGFSTISRMFQFSQHKAPMGVCGFFRLSPGDPRFQNHVHLDFDFFKGGVAGVLPKKDYLWVGAYTPQKRSLKVLESEARRFIDALALNGDTGKFVGLAIPLYKKGLPLQKNRVLLAGEAARLVNPLSGEGILPAMESGKICAHEIIEAIKANGLPNGYSTRIHQEIGRELELAGHFARIAFAFPDLAYHGMVRVAPDTLKIMNGEMSYGDFLHRLREKIKRKILG